MWYEQLVNNQEKNTWENTGQRGRKAKLLPFNPPAAFDGLQVQTVNEIKRNTSNP